MEEQRGAIKSFNVKLEAVNRKIIHIDMDAFFASVEQRDFPEYKGKPLVVGGSPNGRGVVAAASYEARHFGIHSAMSSRKALQLCPHILFIPPRFDAYKNVSKQIREIFSRYTDLIEPLSLDEAYLDVTHDKQQIGSAIEVAKRIKEAIKEELNLTASAGVSINKFVAKVASDLEKPNGLTFIGPSKIEEFMKALPIEKFYGVGKVTAAKMKGMQIHSGADLKRLSQEELISHFGKQGAFFYKIVRGIDYRPVQSNRKSKSVSVEDTFTTDISDPQALEMELIQLCLKLASKIQKHQLQGRTITLKIRYHDFSLITRSHSLALAIDNADEIQHISINLLKKESALSNKKVRLLGISMSNFYDPSQVNPNAQQLKLF